MWGPFGGLHVHHAGMRAWAHIYWAPRCSGCISLEGWMTHAAFVPGPLFEAAPVDWLCGAPTAAVGARLPVKFMCMWLA